MWTSDRVLFNQREEKENILSGLRLPPAIWICYLMIWNSLSGKQCHQEHFHSKDTFQCQVNLFIQYTPRITESIDYSDDFDTIKTKFDRKTDTLHVHILVYSTSTSGLHVQSTLLIWVIVLSLIEIEVYQLVSHRRNCKCNTFQYFSLLSQMIVNICIST